MIWTLIGLFVFGLLFAGFMLLMLAIGYNLCERKNKEFFMNEKRAAVDDAKRTQAAAIYRDVAVVVEKIITDTESNPDAYDALFGYTSKLRKEALRLSVAE